MAKGHHSVVLISMWVYQPKAYNDINNYIYLASQQQITTLENKPLCSISNIKVERHHERRYIMHGTYRLICNATRWAHCSRYYYV